MHQEESLEALENIVGERIGNAKAGTGGFLVLIHAIVTMILSAPKAFSGSSRGYWRKWEMLKQVKWVDFWYFIFYILFSEPNNGKEIPKKDNFMRIKEQVLQDSLEKVHLFKF